MSARPRFVNLRRSTAPAANPAPAVAHERHEENLLYQKSADPLHFTRWKDRVISETYRLYGKTANCLSTGVAYEPQEPTMPTAEELDAAHDPLGFKRDSARAKNKAYEDIVKSVVLNTENLFGYLLSHLSEESTNAVKREILKVTINLQQQEYEDEVAARAANPALPEPEPPGLMDLREAWINLVSQGDVLQLWKSINATHVASRTENLELDQQMAARRYNTLKQGTRTLDEYKNLFFATVDAMEALGCTMPTDRDMAVTFIVNLDRARYESLIDHFSNLGGWPATAGAAYTRANTWKTNPNARTIERTAAVFTATATAYPPPPPRQQSTTRQPPRFAAGRATTAPPPSPCFQCGQMHWRRDCPMNRRPTTTRTALVARATGVPNRPIERHVVIPVVQERQDECAVLIDSQATISIFKNRDLLQNIRPTEKTYLVKGINAAEGDLAVVMKGDYLEFGEVLFHEDAVANVLSWSEVENAHRIEYKQADKCVEVTTSIRTYVFKNVRGHYTYYHDQHNVIVTSVAENESQFSRREIELAKEVKRTIACLGYPSKSALLEALRLGTITNIPFTERDVEHAYLIYGPDIAAIKGKMTRPTPTSRYVRNVQHDQDTVKYGVLAIDIMIVGSQNFLIGVLEELDLTLCVSVQNRRAVTLLGALESMINACKSQAWHVHIMCDGESGIAALESEINARGTTLIRAAPGAHVPKVERKIRDIKSKTRAVLCSLPFNLPTQLLKHLINHVITRINMLPTTSYLAANDRRSPRERFYGVKADYKTDLALPFGQYCQVFDPNNTRINTMDPRTQGAICMGPSVSFKDTAIFWILETKSIVHRSKWVEAPLTREIVALINDFCKNSYVIAAEDELNEDEPDTDDNTNVTTGPTSSSPTTVGDVMSTTTTDLSDMMHETTSDLLTGTEEAVTTDDAAIDDVIQPDIQLAGATFAENMTDTGTRLDEVDESDESTPAPTPTQNNQDAIDLNLRRSSRIRNIPERYRDVFHISETVLHISVREAIKTLGPLATAAIREEALNLLQYKTFSAVNLPTLPYNQRKAIIRSHTFVKKKLLPNGQIDKVRARTTAGGNMQIRSLYAHDDISSPTVALWCVFVELLLARHEDRQIHVFDVKSAYLNASISEFNILMRVEPQLADIIIAEDPSLSTGLDSDGSLVVKLEKALYGCLQSAALWYRHISKTLTSIGFVCSKYDPCTFHLDDGTDKCTVCVYVDDLLLTSTSDVMTKKVVDHLTKAYGTMTHNTGDSINYLGMNFDLSRPKEITVNMDGFISEVLEGHGGNTFKSPATTYLFDTRDCEPLDDSARESFHSTVAKLLYLAKRARPDLLTAVSFLCTRVREPNLDDKAKLDRLIGYIYGTKDVKLTFSAAGQLDLIASVDASFAVHSDFKGHTGAVITLGGATIIATSRKQQRVAKSSTEAELIAVSDTLSQVIMVRNYLIERGVPVGRAMVMQDNMSALKLIEHGRSGNVKTRHFDIALFFAKDRVEAGEIEFKHCPTGNLVADILTKPLQGSIFFKHRARLLNLGISDHRGVLEVPEL